jgi:hypothetical protein
MGTAVKAGRRHSRIGVLLNGLEAMWILANPHARVILTLTIRTRVRGCSTPASGFLLKSDARSGGRGDALRHDKTYFTSNAAMVAGAI